MLYAITYLSVATTPFTPDALNELLRKARLNNALNDVTGMLLFKNNSFIQVLEGERQAVEETYARIAKDPRHRQLIVMSQEPIAQRSFAAWSMGYRAVGDAPVGHSGFLDTSSAAEEFGVSPSSAQKLLMLFKQTM